MNNSRRDFVKKVTIGTAGISIGGMNLDPVYANEPFLNHNSIITRIENETGKFSPVFPVPREAEYLNEYFRLTEATTILLPSNPREKDRFLAQFLVAELAEQYDLVIKVKKVTDLSGQSNYILLGSVGNPLVKSFADTNRINVTAQNPGPEGYFMKIAPSCIAIMGSDEQGAFYGLQSLRQLISLDNATRIQCLNIKDWPWKPFRGVRLNIPSRDNVVFYKRFLRDVMAYFKYNKVIIQVDAYMRFESHPELNAGWIEFCKYKKYGRKGPLKGPNGEAQDGNSSHGTIYEKKEIIDMIDYAGQYFIETIPEIPSLTHSYYLLTRHRELAEIQKAEWPDTYCPSNPKVYDLLFDVLDEYIEVFKPKIFHVGHDEWRIPIDVCDKCRGKDYSELFVQDLIKIHSYLKTKNVRMAIWGDHLDRTVGPQTITVKETGYTYRKPGAVPFDMVNAKIPKDILVGNWTWKAFQGRTGEENTLKYEKWGMEQFLGNFEPYINDFPRRSKVKGLIGGAPSVWSATSELSVGKNKIYKLLGCANLLWSTHYQDEGTLARNIHVLIPSVRVNLKGKNSPVGDGEMVVPVNITSSFNARISEKPLGIPLGMIKSGRITSNKLIFDLGDPAGNNGLNAIVVGNSGRTESTLPMVSKSIELNQDVSSLIFLHACAQPGENIYGHNKGFSPEDTADLLGWYKVIYQDGLPEIIPVRWGINIREWHLWGINPLTGKGDECLVEPFCNGVGSYCYEGDLVNCSSTPDKEVFFFSYEWRNPRFGTEIKEICLEGSRRFVKWNGEVADNNAVALIALSCVPKNVKSRSL